MDKVSVIVPIYKVEEYLRQCLDSIVNQTYQNLEIILVDDGSPDNSGSICDEYAKKDSRIIVIHKKNGGLCAARNDGLAMATGKWIALVDSDDWCELDYYEQMLKLGSKENPDIIISQGRIVEYSHQQESQLAFPEPFHYTNRKQIETLIENIHFFGLPWDKLYKASLLQENHLLFDTSCKAFEDYLFNFQVLDHASNIVGCSCIGYHNRATNTTSITKGFNPDKPKIVYHTLSNMYEYIQSRNITGNAARAIETVAMIAVLNSLDCCYFHPANNESYAQVAKEIKEMKKKPLIQQMIYSKDNLHFAPRQIVLKYAMRLPWVWPVKLLYMGKKFLALDRK